MGLLAGTLMVWRVGLFLFEHPEAVIDLGFRAADYRPQQAVCVSHSISSCPLCDTDGIHRDEENVIGPVFVQLDPRIAKIDEPASVLVRRLACVVDLQQAAAMFLKPSGRLTV